MDDALTSEFCNGAAIYDHASTIYKIASGRRLSVPFIPTKEQMLAALYSTSANYPKKLIPALPGLGDGARAGIAWNEYLDGGDFFDFPFMDCGIPVFTGLKQLFTQGILVHQGHIEFGTAVSRIAVSVAAVGGASALGAIIGSVFFPGFGTILFGMLGGFLGGLTGKVINEREFREARKSYLQAINYWTQRLEQSRIARNSAIAQFIKKENQNYLSNVRKTAQWPHRVYEKIFCGTLLALVHVLDVGTTPISQLPVVIRARSGLAQVFRRKFRQYATVLKFREELLESYWQKANRTSQEELIRQLTEHGTIFSAMITDLNTRHTLLKSALRRLNGRG